MPSAMRSSSRCSAHCARPRDSSSAAAPRRCTRQAPDRRQKHSSGCYRFFRPARHRARGNSGKWQSEQARGLGVISAQSALKENLMPTASGHTKAILASKVQGTPVYNTAGDKIGTVEDVVLDKKSDHIMFAAL